MTLSLSQEYVKKIFTPLQTHHLNRRKLESLLPHSSCRFFFDGTGTATARFAPACRSGGSAPLQPPISPPSISLRIRGRAFSPLRAGILISAWRLRARASIARRRLRLADSSLFPRVEV